MKKIKKILSPNNLMYYPEKLIIKLEKLALEGWKLQKFNNFYITLEECEPKPLKYSFILSPESSYLDGVPTKPQEELIELCEGSGWEYLAICNQMLAFSSEFENVTPIDTDEKLKLETIHKSMKKVVLPGLYVNTFLMIFMMIMQLLSFRAEDFLTSVQLYTLCLLPIVVIHGIINIFQYYYWYLKSKNSIENDSICVKPIDFSWFNYITITMTFLMLLGFIYSGVGSNFLFIGLLIFSLGMGVCYLTINLLRKIVFKSSTKLLIYIVAGTLSTVIIISLTGIIVFNAEPDKNIIYENYNYRTTNSKSIIASCNNYYINNNDDFYMDIKIYDSNFKFVNNQILSGVLKLSNWQINENITWELTSQNDSYTIYNKSIDREIDENHKILCTDTKTFVIDFDYNFDDEFKELVINKLLALN